jgi:hypothetical protein
MQRKNSSSNNNYNGGSFRRSSAVGLPSPSRIQPVELEEEEESDELEEQLKFAAIQPMEEGNIPVIEAVAIGESIDEEFKKFMSNNNTSSNNKNINRQPSMKSMKSIANMNEQIIPPRRMTTSQKKASFSGNSLNPQQSVRNLTKAWPTALRKKICNKLQRLEIDEHTADKFLSKYSWPKGLREIVIRGCRKVPLRFFLVDDSGSMIINDGKRLVSQGNTARLIKCTRWAELTESMLFLAELSESLQVVSDFRLLNGADPVLVGLGDDDGESLRFFREVLNESPAGPTPLCTHIEAIVQCISSVEQELRANNQKAVVMIATDGESSDGNVAEALRPLTDVSD